MTLKTPGHASLLGTALAAIGLCLIACGDRPLGSSLLGTGAMSAGGATSTGGATGGKGTGGASATAGTAGQGGMGGTSCGPCPHTTCKSGFVLVAGATSCCPICKRLDCNFVDCIDPGCPPGTHEDTVPDMCCPTCLPNEFSSSCQKALDEYQTDRQQMIEKYGSLPCKVDEDCVLVAESNRCHEGCLLSFPKATASFFSQNQHTLDMQCSLCPMPTIPPCVSSVALCSNGQCVLGVPR